MTGTLSGASRRCLALAGVAALGALRPPAAAAQPPAALVGTWSRVVANAYMREVIAIDANGAYTSGLCGIVGLGWCVRGRATASRRGTVAVRGTALTLDHGLVNLGRGGDASVEAREIYAWQVRRDPPDDPPGPHSRPPLRTLTLAYPNGDHVTWNEMPAESRPQWVERPNR